MRSIVTGVLDSCLVAVVLVDTSKRTALASLSTVDVDDTLALGLAVAAGAVEFAIVVRVKVDNLYPRQSRRRARVGQQVYDVR